MIRNRVWNNPPDDIRISISSDYYTSGSVYSPFPGINQNFTVVPGVVTNVTIPPGVTLQGGIENKGIRITSVDPISVYGRIRNAASTDAFMALPVSSLGTDYRVVAYTVDRPNIHCLHFKSCPGGSVCQRD